MIQTKLKECSICRKLCKLWKSNPKMCRDCAGKAASNPGISARPKALTEAKKSFKQELNVFFATDTIPFPKACEECGAPFNIITQFDKRCVTAHIIEKSKFKTVASHPMNKMFLGVYCGCHWAYDKRDAKDRVKMKVYPIAIERFNQFKELLTEADLIRANKYLGL